MAEQGRAARRHRVERASSSPRATRSQQPGLPAETPPDAVANQAGLTAAGLAGGAGVTLVALGLYIASAARFIVVGDTPELMTAASTLGVAHPPGYPLLTLAGNLFSHLPLEPAAFRLNLLAAGSGAGAVALVYLSAWRLTGNWPAAAVAGLAVGVSPLFWSWSLVFEAFPLNNLLAALLVYLLVRWQARPAQEVYLIAAAFVAGLGLANHQTVVLLAPAGLYLLWRQRAALRSRPGILAACCIAVLVGLLPYAYIPWAAGREPFLNWGAVASTGDFLALVTRADYGSGQLVAAEEFQGGSPIVRLAALAASFSPLQAALLLAGAVEACRRARWYFWFAGLAFAFTGPAFVAYANMDLSKESTLWVLQRFFLLSHVAVAPLMAFGLVLLSRQIAVLAGPARARLGYAALWVAALAALVGPAAAAYGEVDQSSNDVAARYAVDLLDSVASGALLLVSGDEHAGPLAYTQAVEGQRPDVTLVLMPLLKAPWYIRHLQARYPNLAIPEGAVRPLTLRELVDANQDRPIVIVGQNVDDSLSGSYGYIRNGLVSQVEPRSRSFDLTAIAAENDALLQRYRPPRPEAIKEQTFERTLLQSYAAPAVWVAKRYGEVGRDEEARRWFARALAIAPDYDDAREGLAAAAGR